MVKQQRRTDRYFVPAAGSSVTWVGFPVQVSRRHLQVEEGGDSGPDGDPGETKRTRLDGTEEAAAPTNKERVPGSGDQPGSERCSTAGSQLPSDQQEAAELSELQAVRSLKVTIQQSSESREFRRTEGQTGGQTEGKTGGQTEGQTEGRTGGLHCHVCDITCRSLQVFQDHMMGSDHLRKLKEMTHCIQLNTHTLQDRGRRTDTQRWCDTCQTHFSGDVIIHRRSKQHKVCKQMSRPFCPVCKRHFRTPRKFVEHMKSAEHKQQVLLEEAQEEELITVDAVGCFQEEEEEEEEEEVEEEEEEEEGAEVADEEGVAGKGEAEEKEMEEQSGVQVSDTQQADREEYDPHTIYGSSFVLPVCGFLCRLCNKFFYREKTARHTHCRTHTHYHNLQRLRFQGRSKGQDQDQGRDLDHKQSQEQSQDQERSALT